MERDGDDIPSDKKGSHMQRTTSTTAEQGTNVIDLRPERRPEVVWCDRGEVAVRVVPDYRNDGTMLPWGAPWQCKALTKQHRRCRNPLPGGQVWTWSPDYTLAIMDQDDYLMLVDGVCTMHGATR